MSAIIIPTTVIKSKIYIRVFLRSSASLFVLKKRYNYRIVQITTYNSATDIESSAISCGQCGKINQLASYHRNSSGMVDNITYKNSLAKTTFQKINRDRFSHKIVFRRFNHSSKKQKII
jgi:hypothetical protein